ncbi:nodulin MtN21 family protein [Arabidopsis lyrata subsp. lyrata]|uniref:Nodulin MtN21 family protein n=1 Tax=Arabidopsis lyrata subsp. lyrata TaxID=81972 RepID=D7KME8_ARALL|nr:nodulin MtN21 family protein [Arabidopsis lyrata subsp. lyrata]
MGEDMRGEKVVSKWPPIIVMLISQVAMGSVNALVKKALDVGVNHMIVGAYRMAISSFILAPIAYILERTEKIKSLKTQAGMIKVMGTLICISGALFLAFYKGPHISNSHSHQEALSHNKSDHNTKNWLLGCLYLTIGTVLISLWILFQGTLSIKYPCKFSSTCLMSIFAAFQCALLSLYKSRDVKDWIIDDRFVIGVIVYAGVIGQAMSTVSVTWGVKQLGAVFVSAIMPIALISATLFDFLILHTPLYLGSLIGSVGPIIGLYVFLWGKNKEMEA